uniref:SFRICE_028040 n=1 Tax=Spodoptera frugiperda TaxID=7108 RepID=A0A2H1W960_SPOFR
MSDSDRHAFYPRRGRQRCTLQHVMPLYNVQLYTHFSPFSHVVGGESIAIYWTQFQTSCYYRDFFRKSVKCSSNTLPDPGIEPETLVRQSHLRPLDQRGSDLSDHHKWGP